MIKIVNFIFNQHAIFYCVMLYFSRSHVSEQHGTQVAAKRNCRSQCCIGLAPVGTKIEQNEEQSVRIITAVHANVLCTDR